MTDGTAVAPLLDTAGADPERARIAEGIADQPARWWTFGPYMSERAWGTVREDYGAEGRARDLLPAQPRAVVHGAPTVNPDGTGTKMAFWYRITVSPGETVELRLRLARTETMQALPDVGARFERVLIDRQREADAFYVPLRTEGTTDEEAAVTRRAFAGLVWSQQFYQKERT